MNEKNKCEKALSPEERAQLRAKLDAVVDGIAECRDPDGFIMAYDSNTTARTEHPDYVLLIGERVNHVLYDII